MSDIGSPSVRFKEPDLPTISNLPESSILKSISARKGTHASQETSDDPPTRTKTEQSIIEEPLQRPVEETLHPTLEEPLRRPIETGSLPNFQGITHAIAVDISGSTMGKVLAQETKVAQIICNNLSHQARVHVKILPWDHDQHPVTDAGSLHKLQSRGGGTMPSVLTSKLSATTEALGNCSCWLLFTDGLIDDNEIRRFSRGICQNGLHGTACIIVIFGYKTTRPTSCNVSVGLSVFSAAPHCLFLFHDIDNEEVYLLQSKGAFNEILPKGHDRIIFDQNTLWQHLPKITYQDLSRIWVPAPRKLGADDLQLQSQRTVHLQDIYDDKVDAATVSELLDNGDNLKSLLLSSQLRGQNESVKNWIKKQQRKEEDMLHVPRPDIDSMASICIQIIVTGLRTGSPIPDKNVLQAKLRTAHLANWANFVTDTSMERKKILRRAEVVHDALYRVASDAMEIEYDCSPQLLCDVSPCVCSDSDDEEMDVSQSIIQDRWGKPSLEPQERDNQYLRSDSDELPHPIQMSGALPLQPSPSPAISPAIARKSSFLMKDSPNTDILYIPGYRYDRGSASPVGLEGRCPLCDAPDTLLTLLLKKPPADIMTPGFPSPNSRSGLAFPLAMGTFPETDILSSFVCCDSCAYHMVQLKQSPYDEEIIGAIPLIPEAISGKFQETTLDTVDDALGKRFERPAIEQVLLAIVYKTFETVGGEFEKIEKEALRWISSMISLQISLPATLSPSFSGHLSPRGYVRLPMALSQSLTELSKPSSPFLQYPLGGFVVMIQSMTDLNLEPRPNARKNAVFQRILYHLTEKHHEYFFLDAEGATEALRALTKRPQTDMEAETATSSINPQPMPDAGRQTLVPILSVPIVAARDTHLLSEENWDILQRLGPLFDQVKDECSSAIAVFLHALEKEVPDTCTSIECFDKIRAQAKMAAVFECPEDIGDNMAKTLVDWVYCRVFTPQEK
jgi:hypothetical protein